MNNLNDSVYYSHIRKEISSLLPAQMEKVLEIGCGQGETLLWLKNEKGAGDLFGIEISADSAELAKSRISHIIHGNFETLTLPDNFSNFDLILCLDVLEHLVDPWRAVSRIEKLMRPGAVLITSIPNVRYFRVVLDLIFKGRWEYASSGILDRTHLRFFTKKSAIELATPSGLRLDQIQATGLEKGRKTRWMNWATLSLLKPFFEYQYLIRVSKKTDFPHDNT